MHSVQKLVVILVRISVADSTYRPNWESSKCNVRPNFFLFFFFALQLSFTEFGNFTCRAGRRATRRLNGAKKLNERVGSNRNTLLISNPLHQFPKNYIFSTTTVLITPIAVPIERSRLRSFDRPGCFGAQGSCFSRKSISKNDIRGCDIEGCCVLYHTCDVLLRKLIVVKFVDIGETFPLLSQVINFFNRKSEVIFLPI